MEAHHLDVGSSLAASVDLLVILGRAEEVDFVAAEGIFPDRISDQLGVLGSSEDWDQDVYHALVFALKLEYVRVLTTDRDLSQFIACDHAST